MTFFLCLVFVGLYFFGDFRLNDTHVKTYLQERVTVQSVTAIKDRVVWVYNELVDLFQESKGETQRVKSVKKQKTRRAPHVTTTTTIIPKTKSEPPLDQLSKKDRDYMLKILKNNLNP